jgi:dTMP kinase
VLKRGLFIVLEGPDGSGKTTQAHLLAKRLTSDGYPSIATEEPGGTEIGKSIRELILDPSICISPKTELFLFLADRAEHVKKVIKPALEEGKIVVCSRYIYSTLVYQGFVRKVAPTEFLLEMNNYATDELVPDMVFYIDVDPEKTLPKARKDSSIRRNYQGGDRIEKEGIDFQKMVRKGYQKIAELLQELFITIDGNRSIDEISETLYTIIKRRIEND